MTEPQHRSGDGDTREGTAGELVEAGGDAAPLLELAGAAFEEVALLAGEGVEGGRAASGTAPTSPVGDLLATGCPDEWITSLWTVSPRVRKSAELS
ncbi:hypothetical protein ACFSKW_28270 [Nonomuraea mangrovi]|uniref:Uncharacterized protein n=1 Tax=Nonomuraea mangrovi TaxID=2316207 RepID=A0ABW4T0B7_9ACTN